MSTGRESSTLRPRLGNGSSKHGDAVADKVRDEFRELSDEGRARLDSLADADWGPLATGKFSAQEAKTRPDLSEPPKSGFVRAVSGAVVAVLKAVNNPYALGALALLTAAFIAWLRMRK